MSGIKALDSLNGKISAEATLKGRLSGDGSLKGTVCVIKEYDAYTGNYTVVPKAFESQILETANRVMKDNVTVNEVPYWETSNESGTTVYIAKEVNTNVGI